MPTSLFPSEEIITSNRSCSIETFKLLEKYVTHGHCAIPTFGASQILRLGIFGEQNLTGCLEVSPKSFLPPVALWITARLLLTVTVIHVRVTDVSDRRNHPSFVLGRCLTWVSVFHYTGYLFILSCKGSLNPIVAFIYGLFFLKSPHYHFHT